MKYRLILRLHILVILIFIQWNSVYSQEYKEEFEFSPFIWKSELPKNCPFERSKDITDLRFKGKAITYKAPDTA